jgi:predicted GNAT family N-acyltransferase
VNSEYRVERLGASHDRATFHSGVPELDIYLHRQAGQDARRRVASPFVLLDSAKSILGYYTLSACSVRFAELPEGVVRKLPRYPSLPATLLGRLAVSQEHRGEGLGRVLLIDALGRSLRSTSEVASIGVVVDALDERATAFYLHHEFEPLADHPNRFFFSMANIEKAFQTR